MTRSVGTHVVVAVLCLCLPWLGFPRTAGAGVVTTAQYLELQSPQSSADTIRDWMANDAVRARLVELGVPPAAVEARLASLTPDEQRALAERIDQMPAGGDVLVIIGIVFVVLLILELVGVIDIFKKV